MSAQYLKTTSMINPLRFLQQGTDNVPAQLRLGSQS